MNREKLAWSISVLLIAILDPNQAVDSRYLQYVVATKDGRLHNGILAGEAASSITLRGQDGKEVTVLRSELEEMQSTGKSLMPEGLEKDLNKQQLADLIAYLRASGPPRKELQGNRPGLIEPKPDGSLLLLATEAEIYGGNITLEPQFQNIGLWHGDLDHVVWSVQIPKTGRYDVSFDYACADESAGNTFILEGGQAEVRGRVKGTGGWDKYRQTKMGTVTLETGPRRITLRSEGKITGALLDLKGIRLNPSK